MPALAHDTRRCVPIRLTDVPLAVRLRGAQVACRHEPDPDERAEILSRALVPSTKTYWIAA